MAPLRQMSGYGLAGLCILLMGDKVQRADRRVPCQFIQIALPLQGEAALFMGETLN